MAEIKRKIVVKDFFNPNDHLYEDELGFREFNKEEARSVITREIFEYYICLVHLQMVFYHLDSDRYYAISTMSKPIVVKVLERDKTRSQFIYWQCDHDADAEGKIIATFEKPEDIWDNLKIEGRSLGEIIQRSFITAMN